MKSLSFPLIRMFGIAGLCTILLFYSGSIGLAAENGLDTAKIESITGFKGVPNEKENTFKVSKPKDDVAITVEQTRMAPFMGLTSWAAFAPSMKGEAMVMGDMVLFEDEVNPVMSAALDKGLQVTALHNHFLFDEPRVYFMHIGGEGNTESLARGVRAALDTVKQVRAGAPQPAQGFDSRALPAKSSLDSGALQRMPGVAGDTKDGMFKAVFGRTVKMPCGCEAGKEMGVNTSAAFAGADDNAIVDGDFAVREGELQPVLRSLRASRVNI